MLLLKGKDTAGAITQSCKDFIIKYNVAPLLKIIRLGKNPSDLAYEKAILKRFEECGGITEIEELEENVTQEQFEERVLCANQREDIDGILIFRPLPKHIDQNKIKNLLSAQKDVDCMGYSAGGMLYEGVPNALAPCTARAVIEMLNYYNINPEGKTVTVVGRSAVIGRPVAMLLISQNATVTVCHTKTKDLKEKCKSADILIACAGRAEMIDSSFVHPTQTVIDVGINVVGGKVVGDVNFEDVSGKVAALTPARGGVGSVTTAVLLKQTLKNLAAKKGLEF